MSAGCKCSLKVRDGSNSVSVAVCGRHQSQSTEFRVRVWIVSKGFLFGSSNKCDTGSEAKNGIPTRPSPFFPDKHVCSLEAYVAENSKDPSVQLGVSLFVNGEAVSNKLFFQFEPAQPGSEAEMRARLGRAIQEALRELNVPASEQVVSSLMGLLQVWLPLFSLPVVGAGSSPRFLTAVQNELDKQQQEDALPELDESKICPACQHKNIADCTDCILCGTSLIEPGSEQRVIHTTTKNKRDHSFLELDQTSKRVHVEGKGPLVAEGSEESKHDNVDEDMFTSTAANNFNVGSRPTAASWPSTTYLSHNLRGVRLLHGQSSNPVATDSPKKLFVTNPFDDEDEVKVLHTSDKFESPVKIRTHHPTAAKMEDGKDGSVLSGIGDVLNDSKYGEFLSQVKGLPIDFTSQYKLPRIVVIGSESAGKSSVLERIAMQPVFPRDRNLCTRCPIKLSLRRDPSANELEPVTVRFGRRTLTVLPPAVGDTVQTLMNETVCEINGSLHGIVGEELVIEMRKPNVPTIDLIDLPGIVAASLPDEPGDMMRQTRELVERYVKDPNTLIVAVVPATIKRVRDAQAMQIVQTHNAQNRTIGVLTMADLVHDSYGNDPRWELRERLNGVAQDLVTLPAGYVAVKSRDMREGLSIAEAAVQELEWFKTNLHEFDRNERVSSVALIRQLDRFYTDHIRAKWVPEALRGLSVQAASLKDEAAALGPDPHELGLEGILRAVSSLSGVMEKGLARALSENMKPNFSACFGQPEVASNYPSVAHARQNGHNRKACVSLLNDQWFPDTCVKVAKQVISGAFASSVFAVRLCRFERLRGVLEDIAGECVLENMAEFRLGCLKRIKFFMPTVIEFLELVIEYLFLPFFDIIAMAPPQLQNHLLARGITVEALLIETQEAQRRELNAANKNLLQACQVLKAL